MFARESDAVSPRLGDTNLVSSERTLNSLHALLDNPVFAIGCTGGSKIGSGVCNLHACRKVAWRSDSQFRRTVPGKVCKGRKGRHEVREFRVKNISRLGDARRILRTKVKLQALKVVAATARVTATTAVAQGVRTR